MRFHKYHALGNDYIVIDPATCDLEMTVDIMQLICHRHYGVGSDGILYGPLQREGKLAVDIYNSDGSVAEKSGNGIRIFSRYLREAGYMPNDDFTLATRGGDVTVHFDATDGSLSTVNMGKVTFWSEDIPVVGPPRQVLREHVTIAGRDLEFSAASLGNPHCVVILDEVNAGIAHTYGPLLETHPLFPRRTNVQFVRVLDRANLQIEIWERGSGYTLASGSSSCAAVTVAHHLGYCDSHVQVHLPGGVLDITVKPDYQVWLQGWVASVGHGDFSEEFRQKLLHLHQT